METLADVLARDRRSDAPALHAEGPTRQRYDYRRFLTTAWKAGNFLHKQGVRTGDTVAVVIVVVHGYQLAMIIRGVLNILVVILGESRAKRALRQVESIVVVRIHIHIRLYDAQFVRVHNV